MDEESRFDRRTVLTGVGTGLTLALAGCSSDDSDDGGDGGDATTTETATPTPTPSVEPMSVPEDATCAVCNMSPAKFPDWNAQAVHDDDTRAYFCSTGCATTYYAVTDEFAETDSSIAGFWVTDFESREFVDGTSASYALEEDSERLDDPMRVNPTPFENRDDAVDYVEEVDYLSEDDIVELSAFDRELAERYRGSFLD